MDITNKKIWQQACGDGDRNYSKVCFDWGVILNGPGYAGKLPENYEKYKTDGWTSKKMSDLNRFATEMKDGDIVVLRYGTKRIFGVGIIVGEYTWLECFGDIDGWDLQHVRRVNWIWKGIKDFQTYTLKQGDTTQVMDSELVKKWLEELDINSNLQTQLQTLPEVGYSIDHDEIADYLFEQGTSSNSIENLTKEFDELRRIAKWYARKKISPSESETISYLVVPILRTLGWTPQKMAIEWNNVDLALFDELPREDTNLSVVVEAKKKDNSCLSAMSQAQGYAQGKNNCKRLIVTDGLRYGTFIKNDLNDYELKAYFNLTDLRESYPIYKCLGVKEALRIMTPEWKE